MSSNVTIEVGGRQYRMACADGEEAHIEGLARTIDGKLQAMGNLQGQSEARTLLFACLLLADELHEKAAAPAPPPPPAEPDEESVQALEKMAERLETLAARLESGGRAH